MHERPLLYFVAVVIGVFGLACSGDDSRQQANPVTAATGGVGGVGGAGAIGGASGTTGGLGGNAGGIPGGAGGSGGTGGVAGGAAGAGGAASVAGASGSGGAAGLGGSPSDAGVDPEPDGSVPDPNLCNVIDIPDDVRAAFDLDAFYTRTALAHGTPIVASDSPVDEALTRACLLIVDYGSASEIVKQTMLAEGIYFIMMGADEKTVDTPEFAYLGDLDRRARGLGSVPMALCAEENVMCDTTTDRWRGESICVHEYAHTMQLGVYNAAIDDFQDRLDALYDSAIGRGLYGNTYAGSQPAEYFAEGVQNWYNTNLESRSGSADGVHNHVNTRQEMLEYDPDLYELLSEVLPAQPMYRDCYYYE